MRHKELWEYGNFGNAWAILKMPGDSTSVTAVPEILLNLRGLEI